MLIVARLLQGMGAVSAVCLAYIGDSVRGSEHGKAMMIIGLSIAVAFVLAFIFGALISTIWGLTGVFVLIAVLSLFALVFAVALPQPEQQKTAFSFSSFYQVLMQRNLWALNIQMAVLHMLLAASFFLFPLLLAQELTNTDWVMLYVLPLFGALLVVAPLVRNRDRGVMLLPVFWGVFSVALILAASLPAFTVAAVFILVLWVFFSGFTLIETLLPAQLFQLADPSMRGTSSGIFSVSQFLGNFIGGLLGAKCYTIFAVSGTIQSSFYILAIPALIAVIVSFFYNKKLKVSHGKQRH